MGERDLTPLEPEAGPTDGAPLVEIPRGPRTPSKGVALSGLVGLLLLAALVVTGIQLRATRADRTQLERQLDRSMATRVDLAKEADGLRRRTRLPAIDVMASTVVVLPANDGVVSAISVLIAPYDFSKVWLRVDAIGARPGAVYTLVGGSCIPSTFPAQEWAIGSAASGGVVKLRAGPLQIDPSDGNVWLRLRRGEEDLGGARGPLVAPRDLLANEPACPSP